MNEWLITWLAMWPLWAGMLLCLPAIMMSPGCGCCMDDCGCQQGTNPETWTVVLDGITDEDCDQCDTYNGTYELTRVTGEDCEWEYLFDDAACGCPGSSYIDRISLSLGKLPGGTIRVAVTIRIVTASYACYENGCVYVWVSSWPAHYVMQNNCDGVYCICPPVPLSYEGDVIYRDCQATGENPCTDLNNGVTPGNTCSFMADFVTSDCSAFSDTELDTIDNDCYDACDFSGATCTVTANSPYS